MSVYIVPEQGKFRRELVRRPLMAE